MDLRLSKVKRLKDANDEQNNQARIKNKRLKMSLKIKIYDGKSGRRFFYLMHII